MIRIFLGSLIVFSIAFVITSVIQYFVLVPKLPVIKEVAQPSIPKGIRSTINIFDKVIVKKTVNNTNYLNSWKLTATVIGAKTKVAMVSRGKEFHIIKIKDKLEGYDVTKIEPKKVLFTSKTDDTWLYIKDDKVKLVNPAQKKMAPVGSFTMREAMFKRNLAHPENLLKTVNIVPQMTNGKFQGMKVESLLEGSFLYAYGLRKGDIIKGINGKTLLSIADGISAYQNIINSKKFSISVFRDNKIEELKYEIVK